MRVTAYYAWLIRCLSPIGIGTERVQCDIVEFNTSDSGLKETVETALETFTSDIAIDDIVLECKYISTNRFNIGVNNATIFLYLYYSHFFSSYNY